MVFMVNGQSGLVDVEEYAKLEQQGVVRAARYHGTRNIGMGLLRRWLASIKGSRTLVSLQLQFILLGTQGMRMLVEALGVNVSIRTLNLSNSEMRDEALLLLAGGLRKNQTLASLSLQYNSFTADGARELVRVLENENRGLRDLDISMNSIYGGVALDLVRRTRLKTLSLLHTRMVFSEKLEALDILRKKQSTVETLVLSGDYRCNLDFDIMHLSLLRPELRVTTDSSVQVWQQLADQAVSEGQPVSRAAGLLAVAARFKHNAVVRVLHNFLLSDEPFPDEAERLVRRWVNASIFWAASAGNRKGMAALLKYSEHNIRRITDEGMARAFCAALRGGHSDIAARIAAEPFYCFRIAHDALTGAYL
jgi:hypothetical protein